MKSTPPLLADVHFSDEGPIRHLHLDSIWIQGSMLIDSPQVLVHQYIQRMMAWLLFVEPASVPKRQAMQLGLGAGSLTKFCAKVLRMQTVAVEINPKVLVACRGWFKLPPDNARMRVLLADAAQEIRQPRWVGAIDALQIDLYDHDAAAPVLDSEAFYADCRRVLTDDGCLTVNLFGRSSSYARSVEHLQAVFGREAIWPFKATREGNTVVLAQKTASRPTRSVLLARAQEIEQRWALPAPQWVRVLKPLVLAA
ncbi:MAG: spermidine synthase [Burkholderiaceae bacterium]